MGSRVFLAGALAALSFALAADASAQSYGYFHLPSTQLQFCGLGYGPGHHAPLIRAQGCPALHTPRRVSMQCCPHCVATQMEWFCSTGNAAANADHTHSQLDQIVAPTPSVDLAPGSAKVTPGPQIFNFAPDADASVLPTPKRPQQKKLPQP